MEVQILTYNTHGLPWSRNTTQKITEWLVQKRPSLLGLQEVFTLKDRKTYKETLEAAGYHLVVPEDTQVTLMPSGLVTGFLRSEYTLDSHVFCPYMNYHNVELFANKGFHVLRVRNKVGQRLILINTHTQSDTEASVVFGRKRIDAIRKEQIQQILSFVQSIRIPVLVFGDLNCRYSPHSELRFLTPIHQNLVAKSTFYETGEDIDHVAWLVDQYAPRGCEMCDIERYGPILLGCQIFQLPYSDHAPVLFDIYVPLIR